MKAREKKNFQTRKKKSSVWSGNIDPIQVTKSVNCASYLWILILQGPGINQVTK